MSTFGTVKLIYAGGKEGCVPNFRRKESLGQLPPKFLELS